MNNTVYNFTAEKIYKKTSWERNVVLGATGFFALMLIITFIMVNSGAGTVSIFPAAIGIFTLGTATGIWGLHISEKRQLRESIKAFSIDDILYEINHNCVFIFGRDNKASFFEEGREEGREEGLAEAIRQIMESLHVSLVQAMDILKIDSEKRSKYTAMEELINKQVLY